MLIDFFYTLRAEQLANTYDLAGIARQVRLVVHHAAEELPHDVLAPARSGKRSEFGPVDLVIGFGARLMSLVSRQRASQM